MVVLSASIVAKSGKALLSRQFHELTRIRIESLLAAFPKLIGNVRQHTYVESENVRYVYHPLEGNLFIVLVTNKQSNILEDLETLRLLSKIVPEYCPQLDEEAISDRAFDLIFAFDEAISMGHRENVTLQHIRQYTEMESHEEKLHKIIIQSKINETKDVMKKKASEIEKNKMEKNINQRLMGTGLQGMGGSGGMVGMGPSSGGSSDFNSDGVQHNNNGSGMNMGGAREYRPESRDPPSRGVSAPSRGMVLGKTKKESSFLEAMAAEGEMVETSDVGARSAPGMAPAAAGPTDPIEIRVEEKIKALLNKDGGVESLEIQGTMALQVAEQEDAFIRVHIDTGKNNGFQFKTHPNIDKALHSKQNILGIKDPNRPFPTGSPLGILKWRMQTTDESFVPITINCWPSVSGSESYVNIEYEAIEAFDLQNVSIAIPVPMGNNPQINSIESGDTVFDPRQSMLFWNVELIDESNRSGSLEFVVAAADTDSFFPVDVSFSAKSTFCQIRVAEIEHLQGKDIKKYGYDTSLCVESYQVA